MTFQQEQRRNATWNKPLMGYGDSLTRGMTTPDWQNAYDSNSLTGFDQPSPYQEQALPPRTQAPTYQPDAADAGLQLAQDTPELRAQSRSNSLRDLFSLNDSTNPNLWQRMKRGAVAGLESPYGQQAIARLGTKYMYQVQNNLAVMNDQATKQQNATRAKTILDDLDKDESIPAIDKDLIRTQFGNEYSDVAAGAKAYASYRDAIEKRKLDRAKMLQDALDKQKEDKYKAFNRNLDAQKKIKDIYGDLAPTEGTTPEQWDTTSNALQLAAEATGVPKYIKPMPSKELQSKIAKRAAVPYNRQQTETYGR